MEVEEYRSIPFLDVLVTRKDDGILGHQVFRKKTHIDNYLHAESYHHLNQNFGVLDTLAIRALRISYEEHVKYEINHLTFVFRVIHYKEKDIIKSLIRAEGSVLSKKHQGH